MKHWIELIEEIEDDDDFEYESITEDEINKLFGN